MVAEPDIDRLARTIGDASRIRMLMLLMDGRALTAKELAYGAGVQPATGTAHLRRLAADALVTVRAQGRHRYYRLASADVGKCLEAILVVAPAASRPPVRTPHPLREARFCYDHLAGRLAVALADQLVKEKLVEIANGEFTPTKRGEAWLDDLGISPDRLRDSRRKFAPVCMDWSERRDHIGGALGAALAEHLLERRWIRRSPNSRAVATTPSGQAEFARWFGWCPDCD